MQPIPKDITQQDLASLMPCGLIALIHLTPTAPERFNCQPRVAMQTPADLPPHAAPELAATLLMLAMHLAKKTAESMSPDPESQGQILLMIHVRAEALMENKPSESTTLTRSIPK